MTTTQSTLTKSLENLLDNIIGDEAKVNIITKEEFIKLHQKELNGRGNPTLDAIVANFKNVKRLYDEKGEVCGRAFEYGGTQYEVYYNGRMVSINSKNVVKDGGYDAIDGEHTHLDKNNGHFRFRLHNNSFSVEKIIGVCDCILDNRMPETYENLCVNVMDGSGVVYTADKLGIMPDFRLDNLEWVTCDDNRTHGRIIRKLHEITKAVYRFSANDNVLMELYKFKKHVNDKVIIEYCERNLHCVRKDIVVVV